MTHTRERELPDYLSDVLLTVERYGAMVVADGAGPEWVRFRDRSIRLDMQVTLPAGLRSQPALVRVREVWRPSREMLELREYAYELMHPGLDFRHALHMHDTQRFLRAYGVVNHEHCEGTLGHAICQHYGGAPVRGAIDGFLRLLGTYVPATKPDCDALSCLE